jgi:hypothetical protein
MEFKLHIVINNKSEILNFTTKKALVNDRTLLRNKRFLDKIYRKLYADKCYMCKDLMQLLFVNALQI